MPGSMVPTSPAGGAEEAGQSLPAAFGRYRPLSPIGGGAMGMVYKAHDPSIDRIVAVKVMRADVLEPAARDEYLERFRIEVRAAGRCAHPAIVAVYDFGEQDGAPYIVMEYVEGPTLSAVLRQAGADRKTVAPRLAAAMLQVLDGLGLAHTLGVIQRDVKPSNILITAEGRAKIADFGIARLDIASLTAVGGMVGTPGYMAPEQALGRKVDARTDLFAASAILYEILLGRPPFAGASLPETLLRLTGPDAADLGALAGTPLGHVLARGLQKDPDRRYPSAADLAAAMRAAMSGASVEEATIVQSAGLPGFASGVAMTGAGAAGGGSGSRTSTFDTTLLQKLRDDLARHIGPIADTLLRRAAAAAASEEDLIRACGQMIETPDERAAFLRRHRATLISAPMATMARTSISGSGIAATTMGTQLGASAQPFALSPATEGKVIEALAFHLGPIARVLVRRSSAGVQTEAEFIDKLVAGVDNANDATTIRRKLRALLERG